MALNIKAGSFAKSTSVTQQAVTGVGFQPQAIFFFTDISTTDGTKADASISYGWADASDAGNPGIGSGAGFLFRDNLATTQANAGGASIRALLMGTSADGITNEMTLWAVGSDGFTVNWISNDGAAGIINYFAIGGNEIQNTNTFESTIGTTTGNRAVTGLGFKPEFLHFFNACSNSNDNQYGAQDVWGTFAMATSTTQQAFMAYWAGDGLAAVNATNLQKADKFFSQIATTLRVQSTLVSFDSDGYTTNYDTHDAFNAVHYGMAIKGAKMKVGTFNQKTSTGSQSITGVSFKPAGIILFSANAVTGTTLLDSCSNSLGVASSSSDRASIWWGIADASDPSQADSNLDRTKVIKMITPGATPSVVAAADLTSFDTDGFTLDWSTADSTAREIIYFAIGNDSPSVSDSITVTENISINITTPTLITSYSESNQDSTQNIDGHDPGGVSAIGQSFTGNGDVLSEVKFYLSKTGTPTGNMTAKLYAHTGTYGSTGLPTGAVLKTSTAKDVALLTGSLTLTTFDFDNAYTLVNGTNYFIVLDFTGGSSGNAVVVGYDASSPGASGNIAKFSVTSGTWSTVAGDLAFYLYGVGVAPADNSVSLDSTDLTKWTQGVRVL